jgi:hypothetical protein
MALSGAVLATALPGHDATVCIVLLALSAACLLVVLRAANTPRLPPDPVDPSPDPAEPPVPALPAPPPSVLPPRSPDDDRPSPILRAAAIFAHDGRYTPQEISERLGVPCALVELLARRAGQ